MDEIDSRESSTPSAASVIYRLAATHSPTGSGATTNTSLSDSSFAPRSLYNSQHAPQHSLNPSDTPSRWSIRALVGSALSEGIHAPIYQTTTPASSRRLSHTSTQQATLVTIPPLRASMRPSAGSSALSASIHAPTIQASIPARSHYNSRSRTSTQHIPVYTHPPTYSTLPHTFDIFRSGTSPPHSSLQRTIQKNSPLSTSVHAPTISSRTMVPNARSARPLVTRPSLGVFWDLGPVSIDSLAMIQHMAIWDDEALLKRGSNRQASTLR